MPRPLIKNWNVNENYWDMNPMMTTIKIFKDLHKKDKSKNKSNSSKIMWAIAMYCDPHEENPWRDVNEKDKKTLISEEFVGDEKFSFDDKNINELVDEYKNRCLTIPEKEFIRLQIKIQQRSKFISDKTYTLDEYDSTGKLVKGTADQLDKMLVNTNKIYEQMAKIEKMLNDDKNKGNVRGGHVESASEEGLI